MARYYHFAGEPQPRYSNWKPGYWPGFRGAETRALGNVLQDDLSYSGSGWDGFKESKYVLSSKPGGYEDYLFYYSRPQQGAPEPLSPQAVPQWQAKQLGEVDVSTVLGAASWAGIGLLIYGGVHKNNTMKTVGAVLAAVGFARFAFN